MRICRDCKYSNMLLRECRHPESYLDTDIIDGRNYYHGLITFRENVCKGDLFEPKWWKKWRIWK